MIPRNEYPNPGFCRDNHRILNGEWGFLFDFGNSGAQRKLFEATDNAFTEKITVPFCPESELSGLGYKDFIPAVWYRRTEKLSAEEASKRVFLCFGAVDFHSVIYINGKKAGEHFGGYISFEVEITDFVHEGDNTLTVYAEDDTRSPLQARGKQSEEFYSHGCDYTRTTGIWQTVYLEFREKSYIKSVKYYPDIENGVLTVEAQLCGKGDFSLNAAWNKKQVGEAHRKSAEGTVVLSLKLSETHLWQVGKGGLYDLQLTFGEDKVKSYFGMREVTLSDGVCKINGEPVFQRLVLDQGFYPDGIYTAPTAEALLNDIKMSQKVGFNGARLHQKIFEPLFLYYCDREGYIVWGEQGNWGLDWTRFDSLRYFLLEVEEEVKRDFNHPALIGWCPYNETWNRHGCEQDSDTLKIVYRTVKAIDSTRPCIDTSGNYHVETDIYDVHNYEQNVGIFSESYDKLITENTLFDRERAGNRQTWSGEPVFVSEYGGIRWSVNSDNENAWGYGEGPKTLEEFYERYDGLTSTLLNNPKMLGFCYTQLTDVEQEQNGIFNYDRTEKFDSDRLYKINSKKAAIEK